MNKHRITVLISPEPEGVRLVSQDRFPPSMSGGIEELRKALEHRTMKLYVPDLGTFRHYTTLIEQAPFAEIAPPRDAAERALLPEEAKR